MMQLGISATFALALVTGAFALPQVAPRQNPFVSTPITDFAEPWSLAFLPDDRILVTEKIGQLRLLDPSTKAKGTITGVPTVSYGGQGGLGDVALHPQFATNNLLYFSYVEGSAASSGAVVARARLELDSNGGGALQDVEEIWRQSHKVSAGGHFSHRLLFGSDGMLWISSGDRQQFDPAQDMTMNLGKIIRLYDNGTAPADNPFADQGGVAAQVWALGVRNPLGIDWDAEGRLWEIEMGPMGGDEINLIERGGNYGWPLVSNGNHYDGQPIPDHSTRPEFLPPKDWWTPVISPAGLIVYKGDLFSEWKGNAIIAGLGALGLVRVEISGDEAQEVQRMSLGRRTRCVRQHSDGSIYVLEDGAGGRLLRLTPN